MTNSFILKRFKILGVACLVCLFHCGYLHYDLGQRLSTTMQQLDTNFPSHCSEIQDNYIKTTLKNVSSCELNCFLQSSIEIKYLNIIQNNNRLSFIIVFKPNILKKFIKKEIPHNSQNKKSSTFRSRMRFPKIRGNK